MQKTQSVFHRLPRIVGRAALAAVSAVSFVMPGIMANASATIHPGDKITVVVYNHPDLSLSEITVASDGNASLPLLGIVHVGGLSSDQARQVIVTRLGHYLRYPAVDVRVVQEAQSIFFTGAFNGSAVYEPGETLGSAVGAISRTGSDTSGAMSVESTIQTNNIDLQRVRLERDGRSIGAPINLVALSRNGEPGPILEPGDTIHLVTKPIRVELRGDVKNPGAVYLDHGDSLAQAVAQAGGYSPTTSLSNVLLFRDGKSTPISSAGETMNAPAHDGDTLNFIPAPHVNVLGMVQKPGEVLLQNRPTLYDALYEAGGPANRADMRHVKVIHNGTATTHDLSRLVHGDTSSDVALDDGDTVVIPQGHSVDGSSVASGLGVLATLKYLGL